MDWPPTVFIFRDSGFQLLKLPTNYNTDYVWKVVFTCLFLINTNFEGKKSLSWWYQADAFFMKIVWNISDTLKITLFQVGLIFSIQMVCFWCIFFQPRPQYFPWCISYIPPSCCSICISATGSLSVLFLGIQL